MTKKSRRKKNIVMSKKWLSKLYYLYVLTRFYCEETIAKYQNKSAIYLPYIFTFIVTKIMQRSLHATNLQYICTCNHKKLEYHAKSAFDANDKWFNIILYVYADDLQHNALFGFCSVDCGSVKMGGRVFN